MDGEAVNKVERGARCKSVKEIQNTSYNSHFQKTAQSLAAFIPRCRDKARVFRRKTSRRSNLLSFTPAMHLLSRKSSRALLRATRSDRNLSHFSQMFLPFSPLARSLPSPPSSLLFFSSFSSSGMLHQCKCLITRLDFLADKVRRTAVLKRVSALNKN